MKRPKTKHPYNFQARTRQNDKDRSTAHALHDGVLSTTVDHLDRRVYLFGEVSEENAYKFIIGFHQLDKTKGPITVFLSTYGGDIEAGLAIFDVIKMAKNDVIICGLGPIMSMGVIILQAGAMRLLAPNSRVLLHDGSGGHEATLLKMAAMGREAGKAVERMGRIVSDRCNMPLNEVMKRMSDETFLSPSEAIELNLCDGILIIPALSDRTTGTKVPVKRTKKNPRRSRK